MAGRHYPPGEVLFSRVFVSLVLFSAYALIHHGPVGCSTRGRPGRPCAAQRLAVHLADPAADRVQHDAAPSATAINFSAPLFATLASLVFLKEPVGAARWVALGSALSAC